jgi:PilZ domain
MWEFSKERRAAPRRRINIEFRVLLIAKKTDSAGDEHTLPLIGYTRDISETGVALVVAAKSAGVLYNLGREYTLQLVLTLPAGPVELEARPARYQHVNEGPTGSRILIGAQIIKIGDDDRARFTEYLRSFQ